MNKMEKALVISRTVFLSIWLVIAVFFWSCGLYMFTSDAMNNKFGSWMMWGLFATLPLIVAFVKMLSRDAKKGARDGANDYTVTVSSSSVTVENHPIRGALMGIITGAFVGILFGPVALPLFFIKNLVKLIQDILLLVRARNATE